MKKIIILLASTLVMLTICLILYLALQTNKGHTVDTTNVEDTASIDTDTDTTEFKPDYDLYPNAMPIDSSDIKTTNVDIRNVFSNIPNDISQEEKDYITSAISEWVDSIKGNIGDVAYISSNYGEGSDEIVITVSCDDNTASLHYVNDGEKIDGYITDVDMSLH